MCKPDKKLLDCEKVLDYPKMSSILDIIEEGVWDWSANTGHVERSPGWYRMLNYDVGAFPKTVFTWENLIHPDDYPMVMRHFDDYLSGKISSYEIEYRCKKSDGTFLWIKDQGKIVERNNDGSVARMIGAHLNIHEKRIAQLALQRQNELLHEDNFTLENIIQKRTAELEEANRKLEENIKEIDLLSTKDPLTSIYNRRKSKQDLRREIERAKRYKTPLSAALFDVDNFKNINDTFGHQLGDEVLIKISQMTLDHIRKTDIMSRWGGDEFFIIFPGINISDAIVSLEKIRKLISETQFMNSIHATCSFGVTQYIQDDSIESIYKRVDKGLYVAKDSGRNSVEAY